MPTDVPILRLPEPTHAHVRDASDDPPLTGSRTPRRVQWATAVNVTVDGHRVEEEGLRVEEVDSDVHELDEAAADPNSFRTLSAALEEEKRRSHSTTPPPDSATHSETSPLNPQIPDEPTKLIAHPEVFIDPDERAGLPAPAATDVEETEASAAANLILPSIPKLRLPSRGVTAVERRKALERARRGHDGTFDIESDAPSRSAGVSAGGGILSALLALYDQHDDASDTTSLAGSSSGRGRASRRTDRLSTPSTAESSPASIARAPHPGTRHSSRFSFPDVGKVFGLDGRPAKARSGAGVLGPLIATTAGAASAAAPTASTIVPDVKRPGYHLSRYSLDDTGKRSRYHPHKRARSDAPAPAEMLPPLSTAPARWSGALKDLPTPSFLTSVGPRAGTPGTGTDASDVDSEADFLGEKQRMQQRERKRRKRKAEIFITRHISDVLARQTFICKLARAMMMFGGPSHRLQAQIMSTGRVLEVPLSCMYLPDTMLISFDDQATYTSNIQLIKQGSALDLAKLTFAYKTYWAVIHDEISVKEASAELDELMRSKATYRPTLLIFFGGMASAAICINAFSGSFVDALVCFALGSILVLVQTLSARNELYSNMFEITMCTFTSFVAAGLAQTQKLCYPAIASGSVVLILPGYLFLSGALEISSRSIISGSVRLCYAIIYSLFLGFGLAIGLEIYIKMTSASAASLNATDYTCSASHNSSLWYRSTPSSWWNFLTVPMYSIFLSLRNHAPWQRRELPLLVVISCAGWVTNHYVARAFPNQNDISAAVGAFAVGIIANLYGRFFRGNAFVIMITGIFFQLPSGLSNGGLITFAQQSTSGQSDSYLSGFQTALQLISTCIGMTVGLGISLVLIFPIQSRRRAGGVFSL
ncbi:hypothetical protein K488DRAFT_77075 [Vararia minispora EC-137]|uniref:Uncharacterized protein n=1 Tax=Vararia minispora EC-137 TaxID=1314806 RepID=A0ACB8QSZ9_9AGAM|nr:hypothetical protein K488DRAFT_77075 [Vararia minispora EC-137]